MPSFCPIIQILGAPSFFPTVWGWIKRWFDPVTVSKIFILSDYEAKARLSEFIDPDDFPKRYGGNLDWDFGQPPHLDKPAKEALERDGTTGWIYGPCLWENGQRVPVGTVKGKPRRPAHASLPPVQQHELPIQPKQTTVEPANEQIPSNTEAIPATQNAVVGSEVAPSKPAPLDSLTQPNPASTTTTTTNPPAPIPVSLPPTSPPSMTHSGSTASTSLPHTNPTQTQPQTSATAAATTAAPVDLAPTTTTYLTPPTSPMPNPSDAGVKDPLNQPVTVTGAEKKIQA